MKFLSLILCFVFAIGLFPHPVQAADKETLTIFHTNDVHGNAVGDPAERDGNPVDKGVIGYARYATILNKAREKGNVLVFDAGDNLHGTNFASLSKGLNMVEMLNMVETAALTPGNHDFNYGSGRLKALKEEMEFPLLAANVVDEKNSALIFDDNKVFTVGGLKIGVFGLATEETKVKSSPINTEGILFKDPIATAEEQVAALKAQNVDLIVALSHIGMDKESDPNTYDILDKVKDIDLYIDGHSHTLLEKGEKYKDTMIVSTGSYMNNIGKVELTFSDKNLESISASLITFKDARDGEVDKIVQDKLNELKAENDEVLGTVVGKALVKLDGEREQVRAGETNLGNLLTDAMLAESGADVALTNGGGIRASIDKGDITLGDVLTVLPFNNALTVIEVTGADIVKALEHGTDAWPNSAGKFPHVAGMSYTLKQTADGVDVTDVKVGDEAIDLTKTYKLATNDFMAIGGDGYDMFKGKTQVTLLGLLSDILAEHIAEQYKDGVDIGTEGRIRAFPFLTDRVQGADRYETAVKISQESFATADTVIIANGTDAKLVDALTAAPLADMMNAPLLLVTEHSAPKVVTDEIERLGASKAFIIGGEASVSDSVKNLLGNDAVRVSGASRYETANLIAELILAKTDDRTELYLASGEVLADALVVSNLAVRNGAPILLTKSTALTSDTKAILDTADKVIIAGGEATVGEVVKNSLKADTLRLFGPSRYETAIAIAATLENSDAVAVASGENAADALAVGPILKKTDQVLVLVRKSLVPTPVETYLKEVKPSAITIYGGDATISTNVEAVLSDLVVPAAD